MDNIYFKYQNRLNPQKGFLLISEPYLPDPNFQRTVVLLCEHNDDGTFGFILNKSAKINLKELIDIDIDFNPEVFIGGPVQRDTLHFLHKSKEFNDGVEIKKDLYWLKDQKYFWIKRVRIESKNRSFLEEKVIIHISDDHPLKAGMIKQLGTE